MVKFIIGAVILIILSPDPKEWYENEGLVSEVQFYMICLAFEAPVWFFFMENFKLFVRWSYNRCFRSDLTQGEANEICEGLELSPTEYVSDQMNLVLTSLLFAPIFPPAILLGFAGSVMSYMTRKYYVLNYNKIPRMMAPDLAIIFVDMMPYVVMVWAVAFYTFLVSTK